MPAINASHSICINTEGMGRLWGYRQLGVQRQVRYYEPGPVFLDIEETFNVEACFMSINRIKHCCCYWDYVSHKMHF